jgi:hypothetical protein
MSALPTPGQRSAHAAAVPIRINHIDRGRLDAQNAHLEQ